MRKSKFRRWCPPESRLHIEYPEDLLLVLKSVAGALETSGTLYGTLEGAEVRILTAHPQPEAGSEPVGVFVSRGRGEVFLTESNLELFERENAAVALVIAGNTAGFFVREADNSIQTVRSHEEFSLTDAPGAPPPRRRVQSARPHPKWGWLAVACMPLVALPAGVLAHQHPAVLQHGRPPLTLLVQEDRGAPAQLHIQWEPAGRGHAILQIIDDGSRIAIPVFADQSRATYMRHGSEVQVSLTPLDEGALPETVRFVGQPLPAPAPSALEMEVVQEQDEAEALQAESAATGERIATLEKQIARLMNRRR